MDSLRCDSWWFTFDSYLLVLFQWGECVQASRVEYVRFCVDKLMSIFIWPDSDDIKHILKIAKILSFSPHFNRLNSVNLILHFFADLFCFKFKIQKIEKTFPAWSYESRRRRRGRRRRRRERKTVLIATSGTNVARCVNEKSIVNLFQKFLRTRSIHSFKLFRKFSQSKKTNFLKLNNRFAKSTNILMKINQCKSGYIVSR